MQMSRMHLNVTAIAGNARYLSKILNSRSISCQSGGNDMKTNSLAKNTLKENTNSQGENTLEESTSDMPCETLQNPFQREKTLCILCKLKVVPDYKNVKLLSQFISPYTGRIYGRHITRLCANQQAKVEKEINKAQNAGFMAYYLKDPVFVKDPKLFDPERPIRPHRF